MSDEGVRLIPETDPAEVAADLPIEVTDPDQGEWSYGPWDDDEADPGPDDEPVDAGADEPDPWAEDAPDASDDPDEPLDAAPDGGTDDAPVAEATSPTGDIDQQTLLWAIAGDDAAFARLIQHYDASLCELVFKQVGTAELMDKVLASTYRKAYRALPRLRNAIQPGAWLSSLAAKSCAEELRRQSQRTRTERPAATELPDGRRVDVSGRVDPVATSDRPDNPRLRPKPVELPDTVYGPSSHDEAQGDERVTLIPAEADDVEIDLTDGDEPTDVQLDLDDGTEGDDVADGPPELVVAVRADGQPTPAHLPGFWNRLGRQLMAEREIPARPAPTVEQIRAARAATNSEDVDAAARVGEPRSKATADRLVQLETPASVEELAQRASPASGVSVLARRVGIAALVVIAVGAVAFVAFRIGGNAKPINRTQMTNSRLADSISTTLGGSQTVSARYIAVTTEGGLTSTTSQLIFAGNGSFRLRTEDGSTDIAYDATTGVEDLRQAVAGADGTTVQQSERSGLAGGAPDPHAIISPFLDGDLGTVLTALRDHPDTFVSSGTTKVGGKTTETWIAKVDLDHTDTSPDRAELYVDKQLGVPVRLVLFRQDQVVRETSLSNVVLDQAVPESTFSFPFSDDPVERSDDKFQHTTLQAVPGLLDGFQPATPTYLPDGYELTEVTVHPGPGAKTGPNGVNPQSTDVTSLTYRRGWETITLTTRDNNVPAGQQWQDPFVSTGPAPEADSVTVEGGRFAGAEAKRVALEGQAPYLWGAKDEVMFTVTGDISPDDLVRLIGSIR